MHDKKEALKDNRPDAIDRILILHFMHQKGLLTERKQIADDSWLSVDNARIDAGAVRWV